MKPATRNTSALAKLLPAYLLIGLVATLVVTEYAAAGHHSVDSAQTIAGCIDGACGPPPVLYGHYQGSWRRWPHSKDTPLPNNRRGTQAREPFVPDAVEEGRTRAKTRSDRPLDPEDMGSSAGVGALKPLVPGANDEANPFNNTVDESDIPSANDLPAGGNPFPPPAGGDGFQPPAGGDMFAPPAGGDTPLDNNPAPDPVFDTPAETPAGETEGMPDLFGQSDDFPAPPAQQVRTQGAIRSIKSRGVSIQTGIQLKTTGSLPNVVGDPEISLPSEGSVGGVFEESSGIGQVSFEDFETKSRSKQMPKRIAKLSKSQVAESTALPTGNVPKPAVPVPAVQDAPAPVEVAIEPEVSQSSNPLRRGTPLRKNVAKSTKKSSMQKQPTKNNVSKTTTPVPAPPVAAKPLVAAPTASVMADSRTLSHAVASRSLRDTLRKNPLRR